MELNRTDGEHSRTHKLSDDDVRAIRQGYAAGESKEHLAERFKISPCHVMQIVWLKRRASVKD